MNRSQLIVLWLGIVIAICALAVPPRRDLYGGTRGFIPLWQVNYSAINTPVLVLELGVVAAVTYAGIATVKARP